MLTDHLKELFASLRKEAYSNGQVEICPIDEVEVNAPGADDSAGTEMKSLGADDLVV